MNAREIRNGIMLLGAQDWNRRLFDSLIPLPDGTSYNSYLIPGTDKVALIDTIDPPLEDMLMAQLENVPKIDYMISLHSEQDHSGTLPKVLNKYPEAKLICSPKAKDMLLNHLDVTEDRIQTVADGEVIDLGGRTLRFVHIPWVHWPETMAAYLEEDKILFPCDFLGSHIATTKMYAGDRPEVMRAAKRYFGEIMMPFRTQIRGNLDKISKLDFDLVCPSHGPLWDKPEVIISAYEDWVAQETKNLVVIPYISMHGSTQMIVDYLTAELVDRGVQVQLFDLTVTDIGDLAMGLVDARTIVVATPTVHVGPHPFVLNAVNLANAIRPKVQYAAIVGSYGWATRAVDIIAGAIPNLKVEVLGTVMAKGLPKEEDYQKLSELAEVIAEKHK